MRKRQQRKLVSDEGDMIVEMLVDNPMATWSQFLHELETDRPHAGKQAAMVNRRVLMGGFCRFHGTQAQEQAAARFKAIYERSQVGGAKAVDPSREPVDGGGINPESVIEIGADARGLYNHVYGKLGRQSMMMLEFVVIGDHGPTAYARWRLRLKKPNQRQIGQAAVEIRGILEQVAVALKLQTRVDRQAA